MADKILVIEDELTLQETLAYNLNRQGYEVNTAGDGRTAIAVARAIRPDLILLDVMLPELDGFEVCRILRKEMNVPILMLTARESEIDRVVGLEIGADDYITKPFSMRELMARVKAHLRSVHFLQAELAHTEALDKSANQVMNFSSLSIDTFRRQVFLNNRVLSMKPKEYELLVYFAQHPGQALSREEIMQKVWGWDFIGDSRTVDIHVSWLRQKIEPHPTVPQRIITIKGSGYRFEG
jgi:DNA-binding response OmpR family regulator